MSQVQAGNITALNLLSINVYNFWVTEQGHIKNIYNLLIFQKKGFITFSLPVSFQKALPLLQDWSFLITHNALTIAQNLIHGVRWAQALVETYPLHSSPKKGESRKRLLINETRKGNYMMEKKWRWESQRLFCRTKWKTKR